MTSSEAQQWCRSHGIELDPAADSAIVEPGTSTRFGIPKEASRQLWFCGVVESALQPWTHCLLWTTAWGIWASSENWHLYYRLRQTYGDFRLMEDAPAHLFLKHEREDLLSFIQLGLGAGWDMRLLTSDQSGRCFISHDEWAQFVFRDVLQAQKFAAELKQAGLSQLAT